MKHLTPRRVNRIYLVLLMTGIAVGSLGLLLEENTLLAVGAGVLLVDVLFRLLCYRCPHCGCYLTRCPGDLCPRCGKNVEHIPH